MRINKLYGEWRKVKGLRSDPSRLCVHQDKEIKMILFRARWLVNNALPPCRGQKVTIDAPSARIHFGLFFALSGNMPAEVNYAACGWGRRRPRPKQKDPPGINKHVKLLPSPAALPRNNKLQSALESIGGALFPFVPTVPYSKFPYQ